MKIYRQIIICFFLLSASIGLSAQQVIHLYEGKIPNSIPTQNREQESSNHFVTHISEPSLSVFLPAAGKSNGTAIIICPGGGYRMVNIKTEGYDIAQKFSSLGITAFVLKYRLPDDSIMVDKSIGPLQDAQQAILVIKKRSKEWNIDSSRIGIMGFSAGGHLAASAGTHFSHSYIENPLGISLRPAFMILIYPVISFSDSIAERNTRSALIGKDAGTTQTAFFSNELQVSPETPPTFLMHAEDDRLVPAKNSIEFFLALQKNKVPAGMHIFSRGQHGFVLEPAKTGWFDYCEKWLKENGWVAP
jgi:acetyl esterase/lipase